VVSFIVDPFSYDKTVELARAREYVDSFLDANDLDHVSEVLTEARDAKDISKWTQYGWYDFETRELFVNVKRSRTPVKTPGFSWSFTGSKADLTAPGILAHETGHHIHNLWSRRVDPIDRRKLMTEIVPKIRRLEPAVSGYEPNVHETIAEAMRLFIMNPSLLREGRPVRWALLTDVIGVHPLHDAPWHEVLKNAHPKLIASLEKWIERRN